MVWQNWQVIKILLSLICIIPVFPITSEAIILNVETTAQLQAALRNVQPGDTIQLAEVEFYGFFRAEVDGTEQNPITIQGMKDTSIISSWSTGFNLEASHYILQHFTVANSMKGIMITGGSHNLLQNLIVRDINEEGIHMRTFSSDNVVQHCQIYNTGTTRPGFGEGVYIGSDYGKWTSPSEPDLSNRNIVRFNTIGPGVGGEGLDIKEGSCCGRIEGNFFDGRGMSNVNFDDSWVDIKGSDYLMINNIGDWTLQDGFQVRSHMPNGGVSGCRNIFKNNSCNLGGASGFAIYLASVDQCENSTIIYADNSVQNGGGLTNGWITPI